MVECLQSNHLDMVVGRRVARGAEKNFAYRRGHQWGTAASPVTVHALDLVLPIREVDCPYSARPDGSTSKPSTYRDGTRITLTLIYVYEQVRPALSFGLLGGMMAVLSLGLGIPVVLEFLRTGLVLRLPTAVLTSMLMLLAVLTGACGVILDSVGRRRKEAKRLAYLAAASI